MNHKSAPIELRERLAFNRDQLPEALNRLREELGLMEAAILSTCNRVEIYAGVSEVDGAVARVTHFLSERAAVDSPLLTPRLYSFIEPHSVQHLFSVASGLDSMVLGEGEILCQVKHAYEWARDHGATGKALNGLFQRALNTAKAVRTHTAIGRGATSIGTVSVELAEKIFGRLPKSVILLVGAGKIGELTLRRLIERGASDIRIVNRSAERAGHLAADYRARALAWSELPSQLLAADIAITSTSAPSWLLSREDVAAAMPQRHQRPLCLVDLGVPRNIEPSVGALENVYLFNIDDLQGLVEHAHRERQQAVQASQRIIDQKVGHFLTWWQEEVAGGVPCVPSCSGPAAAP
ncbi:MAG: glutamyl-tRNA reductase [Candidatus Omnitrophica bacterium]|nr:glutamyl-tRNA reductase [Candidatus Omnitrophota bacterium]